MDAAQEAASITGFNEKTVRLYRKEFFEQKGNFKESRQGKYERPLTFWNHVICFDVADMQHPVLKG